MNLTASMYTDTPPANDSQRRQTHFHVQLAARPGAGGVHEAARIEQPGGDGQNPHQDQISELAHLMFPTSEAAEA